MATTMRCCGAPITNLRVTTFLVVQQPGSASLSGVHMKLNAQYRAQAFCDACGWFALGHLENPQVFGDVFIGGHFVADPVAAPASDA